MPKMDGIELVSQLGGLDHQPMVLVISGYDDFSYAVEMLRSGAFDYLLKPVERERLFEALEKLEGQYRQKQDQQKEQGQRFLRVLRHLMLEQDTSSPEWREQAQRCRDSFFPGPYVGFCAGDCPRPLPEGVLRLHAVRSVFLYACRRGLRRSWRPFCPPRWGAAAYTPGRSPSTCATGRPTPPGGGPFSPGSPAENCRPRGSSAWRSRWSSSPGWRGCPGVRRSYSS